MHCMIILHIYCTIKSWQRFIWWIWSSVSKRSFWTSCLLLRRRVKQKHLNRCSFTEKTQGQSGDLPPAFLQYFPLPLYSVSCQDVTLFMRLKPVGPDWEAAAAPSISESQSRCSSIRVKTAFLHQEPPWRPQAADKVQFLLTFFIFTYINITGQIPTHPNPHKIGTS